MKKIVGIAFAALLFACNGGEHEPVQNLKDSTAANSSYEPGQPYRDKTDTIYADSTVGRDTSH